MIDETQVQLMRMQAEICKTLADVKRLMIVHELRDGEKSVGQLVTEHSPDYTLHRLVGAGGSVFREVVR